jgi:hypothetical protein
MILSQSIQPISLSSSLKLSSHLLSLESNHLEKSFCTKIHSAFALSLVTYLVHDELFDFSPVTALGLYISCEVTHCTVSSIHHLLHPSWIKTFFWMFNFQTLVSTSPPSLLHIGVLGLFPWSVKLIHIVLRSGKVELYLHSPHVFMYSSSLIVHRDYYLYLVQVYFILASPVMHYNWEIYA